MRPVKGAETCANSRSRRASSTDCCRERRRCGVFIRLALIDRFRGVKRRFFQPLGTREFDLHEPEPILRRLNGSDRLLEFDLKWARINHEERIAFLNDLSIRKEDFRQHATDLRTKLGAVDG